MIDIIIPAYNSHQTIERTLYSIAYQDIKEKINIYIVNDSSNKDYKDIVKFFQKFINIKELTLTKNIGPGGARQYGIDNSNSEYIIFIDSDDVFSNCYAISTLFNSIKEKDYDLCISNFIEETNNQFIHHKNDTVWLHGKIYKRKFLENNNIRFNNTRANEDNGFNQLILLHEVKLNYIPKYTYIWCNNINSITRKNNHQYKFAGLEGYIYNINWALEQAIKDHCSPQKISELSFAVLVAMYFYYLEFKSEILIQISKKTREISRKYPTNKETQKIIFQNQKQNFYDNPLQEYYLTPIITFNKFLNKIDKVGNIND